MKMRIAFVASLLLIPPATFGASRPNILIISIDDLNDWTGCLGGHPQAKTPNIDRLAKRGTLFRERSLSVAGLHVVVGRRCSRGCIRRRPGCTSCSRRSNGFEGRDAKRPHLLAAFRERRVSHDGGRQVCAWRERWQTLPGIRRYGLGRLRSAAERETQQVTR